MLSWETEIRRKIFARGSEGKRGEARGGEEKRGEAKASEDGGREMGLDGGEIRNGGVGDNN